jgi:hypothetical protein
MKIRKLNTVCSRSIAALVICALLPAVTCAGDLTGTNTITGSLSSASGFGNFVSGNQAFASGQQNDVGGNFNSAYGFGHFIRGSAHLVFGTQHSVDGGGNAIFGFQNRASASSLYNFVTGSFNTANGANAWIGGSSNTSTGNRSLLFGQFLDDGGLAGSVMLSDSNPFDLRTAAAPFANATPDTFNGTFDRGYFLFTSDGQGANPDAGLFVVPTPPNTATVTNPAFVGINKLAPTKALDVVGDANVAGEITQAIANNGVVKASAVIQGGGAPSVARQFNNLPIGATITVIRLSTGSYEVDFGTDITSRFYLGTLGGPTTGISTGQLNISQRSGNANALFIRTTDSAGTVSDALSFTLMVY